MGDQFGAAGEYQVVLKEIDLPVVSNGVCQDKLRSTRLGQKFKLHDSFLCAGIVAWGIGCGENGTPGVYADVSKATCWIDQVMTCHYGGLTGDYNSFNGYTSNVCGTWYQNKIADLTQKAQAGGRFGQIFQNMINEYSKCIVNWEQPTAPLVDISDFERANDNYSGAEEEVKAAPQVEQEQPYEFISSFSVILIYIVEM